MKNILITGVSSGIGNYLADKLKSEYRLFGISRQDPLIPEMNYTKVDISDPLELQSYLDKIKSVEFDTLILNAGVGFFDEISNLGPEEIIKTINTNLTSNILIINTLQKHLPKDAKIIFIGSVASKKFFKHGCVYQASKFGLRGFAGSLRNEVPQKVFLLNPQFVESKNFFKNSKVGDYYKHNETKVEDIFFIVNNILNKTETKFEIDF